jgi:hypothetical protein
MKNETTNKGDTMNAPLVYGEVRPENARRYNGDGNGGKGCTMVTTDGHWTVNIRRTQTGWKRHTYTVSDDVARYAEGVDQKTALAAMRKRWADRGATVFGVDSCWRAFLR